MVMQVLSATVAARCNRGHTQTDTERKRKKGERSVASPSVGEKILFEDQDQVVVVLLLRLSNTFTIKFNCAGCERVIYQREKKGERDKKKSKL